MFRRRIRSQKRRKQKMHSQQSRAGLKNQANFQQHQKRGMPSYFSEPPTLSSLPVAATVQENEAQIRKLLGNSPDVLVRHFTVTLKNSGDGADGKNQEANGESQGKVLQALLLVIDGLVDETAVRSEVLQPLMDEPVDTPGEGLAQLAERIYVKDIRTISDLAEGITKVLQGGALLLFDTYQEGLLIRVEGFEARGISEPPSEPVVRGSREGFIESIGSSMALLRRRLPHHALRFETLSLGEYSRTRVAIAYMEGIAHPDLVSEVKKRLQSVKVDSIVSSGEVEQYIEDNSWTLFPTIGNTERPEKAAAMIMGGRVLMMVDGDPITLYGPRLFIEAFQSTEDYSSRPYYASFVRLLRFFAFFFSSLLPAYYIAALNFHKELIPSRQIITFSQSREQIPFPLVVEIVLMTILFELVREAGIRMPRPIGSAVSIVGALILGDVSVSAGLVSAPTIIVVALASISSFIITPIADVVAILRFLLIFSASLFGIYGILGLMLGLLTHMVSLTSFGIPYMAPIAPFYPRDWKDTLFRLPIQWQSRRSASIPNLRPKRARQVPPLVIEAGPSRVMKDHSGEKQDHQKKRTT